MTIQTACPHCDRRYTLTADKEGKTVKCKGCEKVFVIQPLTAKKAKAVVTEAPSKRKAPPPEEDVDAEVVQAVDDEEAAEAPVADDDAQEEAERPSRKSTRKKTKAKKRAKSGALMWVLLMGGGVLALLVLGGGGGGIGLYFLLHGGGTPLAQSKDAGTGGGPSLPALGGVLPVAHVNEETFDQLRTGMTEDELVAVVGPPTIRTGPDKSAPEPVLRPGVVTETILVKLTWKSGKNKIEVIMDEHHKAEWGKAWFDDGQGGLFELFGNKFDQLTQMPELMGQIVNHRRPDGGFYPPPEKPAAPPGPAKVASSKIGILGKGMTADQVLQRVGEPPTKKLGPQLMPDGKQSADTWEWDNGNGFLKVHFDASGKVVFSKKKDLPFS